MQLERPLPQAQWGETIQLSNMPKMLFVEGQPQNAHVDHAF